MPLLWGWSLGWGRNRMPLLRTSGRCDIPACHPVPSSPGWAGMVFISWGCCELNCFEPWSAIMKVGGCFDSWCSGSILVRQAWRHAFKPVHYQSSGTSNKQVMSRISRQTYLHQLSLHQPAQVPPLLPGGQKLPQAPRGLLHPPH